MPKTYLIAIIIGFVSLVSCKKDPPPPDPDPPCMENGLPCLTTVGANMFACKVNGEPWIAQTPFSFSGPSPLSGNFTTIDGDLSLNAVKKIEADGIYEYIKVYGYGIEDTGIYEMHVTNENQIGYRDLYEVGCFKYFHDTSNKGEIEIIHFDTVNSIIAGTFYMILKNDTCNNSEMHITEGRFDFKYAY